MAATLRVHGLDSPDGSQLGLGEVGGDERVSHLRACKVKHQSDTDAPGCKCTNAGFCSEQSSAEELVIRDRKDRVIFVLAVRTCVTCLIGIHS